MAEPSHPNPEALLRFLQRPDQTLEYAFRTAAWIKTEYPGSAEAMLPRIMAICAEKQKHQSRG